MLTRCRTAVKGLRLGRSAKPGLVREHRHRRNRVTGVRQAAGQDAQRDAFRSFDGRFLSGELREQRVRDRFHRADQAVNQQRIEVSTPAGAKLRGGPIAHRLERFASMSGQPLTGARLLVQNPADPEECFAAVSEPGGYVVAVGNSLWSAFSTVGWPYDNDRFLANPLVGGDAEVSAVLGPGA